MLQIVHCFHPSCHYKIITVSPVCVLHSDITVSLLVTSPAVVVWILTHQLLGQNRILLGQMDISKATVGVAE